MTNDQEIGAELHRLVADDPLDPIDATALLERGRKGRRRRRAISVTGVVGAVAAVAVAASLLPRLNNSTDPAVAGASPSVTTSRPVRPALPVDDPRVDDATLLKACQQALAVPFGPPGTPAGSRPGRGKVDLSHWRMVSRMTLPTIGTMMVAASPDNAQVATCELYAKAVPGGMSSSSTTQFGKSHPAPATLSPNLMSQGTNCGSAVRLPSGCQGFLIAEVSRVPARVVKIHVDFKNGRTLNIAVKDGWYAMMAASGHNGLVAPEYKAYDAAGKVVPFDGEQALESVRYK